MKDHDDRVALLVRATELLHAYGTPAHRLERVVVQIGASCGTTLQVFSTPTSIFLGFHKDSGIADPVRLLRVEPGGVDLGKLVELDEILEEAESGAITHARAIERMDALDASPRRFSTAKSFVGHALAAGTAAILFGGTVAECAISAVLGLLIAALEVAATRRHGVASLFEPLAAFLAAATGVVAAHASGGSIDARVVSLASIIVLLPGLSLTVALLELATRHLASGTARLAGAASVFLTIAFGAFLGSFAGEQLVDTGWLGANAGDALREPLAWLGSIPGKALSIVLASVGFALLFRARRRELPWIVLAGSLGYGAAQLATALQDEPQATGGAVSAYAGALAVGVLSNVYARLRNRPATVAMLPGLLVLVPGSIGYRALSAFAAHDALTGIETAYWMMLVGAALVGGILTANAVAPPRRIL